MFDEEILEAKFARIGARLKFADPAGRHRVVVLEGSVRLDVGADRKGEFFEIARLPHVDSPIEVLDIQPADRHLLLMVRERTSKHKFLCGHDERHWFVAAIPESAPVGTVRAAKEALKPREVRTAQARMRVAADAGERRKNAAFRRQGEWFFIPEPGLTVDESLILRNEPITRGHGKPHRLEFCYRSGGETVWVCGRYPAGVSSTQYQAILKANPKARAWGWRSMVRNPAVYARGRVRHADHRVITLHDWHRVVMNTENESQAMRHVAFLD